MYYFAVRSQVKHIQLYIRKSSEQKTNFQINADSYKLDLKLQLVLLINNNDDNILCIGW